MAAVFPGKGSSYAIQPYCTLYVSFNVYPAFAPQKPGAAMAERKAIMAQKEARMQDFHFVPGGAGAAEGARHTEA